MTRYALNFRHRDSGEEITVVLAETAAEAECARMRKFWAWHPSLAQRAAEKLPEGFEQVLGSLQQVTTN